MDWNLNDPKEAREFLKSLRIGPKGAKIQFLQTEGGQQISIDEASDFQILKLVRQMAQGHADH